MRESRAGARVREMEKKCQCLGIKTRNGVGDVPLVSVRVRRDGEMGVKKYEDCLNPHDNQAKRVYRVSGVAPTINAVLMNVQPSVLITKGK